MKIENNVQLQHFLPFLWGPSWNYISNVHVILGVKHSCAYVFHVIVDV